MFTKVSDLIRAFPSCHLEQPDNIIPSYKRWHLLMDKSVQKHNNPYYFDQNSINGMPEPGYKKAMTCALRYILYNIETPLSCYFLLELHTKAIQGVKTQSPPNPPKPFPTGFIGAGIFGFMTEIDGVKMQPTPAAIKEWESEKLIYDLSDPRKLDPWAQGYLACYKPAHIQTTVHPPMPVLQNPDFLSWAKQSSYDIDIEKPHYQLWLNQQSAIIISILGVPSSYKPEFRDFNQPYTVLCLNQIMQNYKTQLTSAANDDEKKLLAIVRCIRALEIAHPFADTNQRVFVFLLLNKLLLQNGFLPVILENPFVFDGYLSAAELVDELKKGFQNFLQTVHNITPTDSVNDTLLIKT